MRRAKLSDHMLYDLRRTFASTLLAKSVPLTYVSDQLGHSTPDTTLRYYAHSIPSDDKRFVDALDRVLAPLLALTGKSYSPEGEMEASDLRPE